MGYAVFKSGYLPRGIGILLMIGCFGYLFDSFTALLLPDFDFTVAQFTFIGELLLPLWLVVKGSTSNGGKSGRLPSLSKRNSGYHLGGKSKGAEGS